jgi:hypothetical protein
MDDIIICQTPTVECSDKGALNLTNFKSRENARIILEIGSSGRMMKQIHQ